jgi:hypothetical protein
VQAEERDFLNLIPHLEETTDGLMAAVMEVKVLDPEKLTGAGECCADTSGLVGKYPCIGLRLPLHDVPALLGVAKAPMIAVLAKRVLGVAD